ncbi:hypothetical protein J2T57_000661 [Natronocella acetinitrilica]|uniref:DUF1116 domain-containing protein n=1 Tax=Natronocella acetinitrilica TaxID=414046 RepID=A0AAE3G134_9GAMM|nr:DUF1116 domain-containing protein [Natronocella acetinitrilica]MCP1673569.1 hypothetical protein [Natronocella acetinitrilica]
MSIKRPAEESVDEATRGAALRMAASRPVWERSGTAEEFLNLPADVFLHAGPPLSGPDAIPLPMLHGACAALLFEGRADSYASAREQILSGAVSLRPAQDVGLVTPLAAVVSRSMWLHRVIDANGSNGVGYAPISDGTGPAQRFGLFDLEVVERLRFVHEQVAPALEAVWAKPVDILPLARESLSKGDELHGRVGVGSAMLGQSLGALSLPSAVQEYVSGNPQGFLNLWMAACRCMVGAAMDGKANMLVIAAGGNGIEFGIKLGKAPDTWLTAPAGEVVGPALRPALAACKRLPAIGDSALIDAVGLGALALDAAPEQAALLADPGLLQSMERVREQALVAMHPGLQRMVGMNASAVAGDCLPGVCLAALDADGALGIVGRGVARHPLSLYT